MSKTILALMLLLVGAVSPGAQEKPEIEVTKLADQIYKLSYDGGGYTVKVIASIGEDGILLVDAGQPDRAEDIKAVLATLRDEPPRIIISTHVHVEHLGANHMWGDDPVIIGHRTLRSAMRSGGYLFEEFPDEALPDIMITDSTTVHFNGEDIIIFPVPAAHTDHDLVVWFTGSKIACVGAICNGHDFPSVDYTGNVMNYATVARSVLDFLPEDVLIVPGHGADCSTEEFGAFCDMLVATSETVARHAAEGMDVEAMKAANILADWSSYGGSYMSLNAWIETLARGMSGEQSKQRAWEPMYYAIRDRGAEAAVEYYFELRSDRANDYRFPDSDLAFIGYRLYMNNRISESIPFFERYLVEYPDGQYNEFSYEYLGLAYESLGDKKTALENFRRVLELNPENEAAAAKISELGD
ncbi:MAG: tetratricopeptide repeat protein [Candidatus Zixiibacteriota bacterium]|nr:MAG: tetratricopeptide repeat protein [candidate division Zixibacteria bacterium]